MAMAEEKVKGFAKKLKEMKPRDWGIQKNTKTAQQWIANAKRAKEVRMNPIKCFWDTTAALPFVTTL